MTNPKGYIIHLKNHQKSVEWSNHALTTGQKFGWKLELYDGVDGTKEKLEDYKVKIYPHNKKCVRLLSRPGTQGCFLSQYKLWKKCFKENKEICVFEHDVVFKKPFSIEQEFSDILKFEGFQPTKPMPVGQWWEGARAYCLKPSGAKKLLDFVKHKGAMPADWCINNGILDVKFDLNNKVTFDSKKFSFTKDLK
jgi:GR25 family glycosyltransferase involved in LPS biosynthesis|tara:strand:- start:1784 stop:2365 length:582 start_codon:yes stop_codon:yes gene_type:complete